MLIKEFSQRFQISTDTIRYYEKLGLLLPKKNSNGYRSFDEGCVDQLQMIIVLKHLGFTLQEIQQLATIEKKSITPELQSICYDYF